MRDEEELTRERWCEGRETRNYKIVCQETESQIAEWGRENETPRRGSDLLTAVDVDFRRRSYFKKPDTYKTWRRTKLSKFYNARKNVCL